jgi:phage-related protein
MKPVHWMGSSLDDLKELPDEVRSEVGYSLYAAQWARKR